MKGRAGGRVGGEVVGVGGSIGTDNIVVRSLGEVSAVERALQLTFRAVPMSCAGATDSESANPASS